MSSKHRFFLQTCERHIAHHRGVLNRDIGTISHIVDAAVSTTFYMVEFDLPSRVFRSRRTGKSSFSVGWGTRPAHKPVGVDEPGKLMKIHDKHS